MSIRRAFDIIPCAIICVFCVIMCLFVYQQPEMVVGECDDYMITTIALQNHWSIQIKPDDIERAQSDYTKETATRIKESWDNIISGKDEGGFFGFGYKNGSGVYPWYMGTYSLACVPIKLLLQFLNLNQTKAFGITNVLLYCVALLFVTKEMRLSNWNKIVSILLIIFSPSLSYAYWPSAEIFMFSALILSSIFLFNKKFNASAICIAAAGTLNPTIMVFGFFIIYKFYLNMYFKNANKVRNIFSSNNIKKQSYLGISFLPFFITFVFNYIKFGTVNLQIATGALKQSVSLTDILLRMQAYIVDLSFGFLPYFCFLGIAILFSVFFLNSKLDKSDIYGVLFTILAMIFSYSIMLHINCGMTGISRYNAWSWTVILFLLWKVMQVLENQRGKAKNIIYTLLVVSIFWSGFVVIKVGWLPDDSRFNFISKFVLNNVTWIYNPLPSTFTARTTHIADGGYNYTKPVIYSDKGFVRKILINNRKIILGDDTKILQRTPIDNWEILSSRMLGKEDDINWLKKQVTEKERETGFHYINIPSNIVLLYIPDNVIWSDVYTPNINNNSVLGLYGNEQSFRWTKQRAFIYLKNKDFEQNGMLVQFTIPEILLNRKEKIDVEILVNNIVVATLKEAKVGECSIYIGKEKMKNTVSSIGKNHYVIEIATNKYFIPAKVGKSLDKRELALQLKYIGTKRNGDPS